MEKKTHIHGYSWVLPRHLAALWVLLFFSANVHATDVLAEPIAMLISLDDVRDTFNAVGKLATDAELDAMMSSSTFSFEGLLAMESK